jgi:hypothetical protein
MKRTYFLTILTCGIIAGGFITEQTLHAESETSYEMEKGTAYGDETAGPIGAAVGGIFGGAVGLAKDTGNAVTGTDYDIVEEPYEEDFFMSTTNPDFDTYMPDETMYEHTYYGDQSETAREMNRGAAKGEEVAGSVGAAVGGLLGGAVGLVEDTGELVSGRPVEDVEEEVVIPAGPQGMYEESETPRILTRPAYETTNRLMIDDVE